MIADRQRFDALVALYPTGALARAERDFVETYAERDPDAAAALDWHIDLAECVNERVERRTREVPETVGWTGLEAHLRAERLAHGPALGARLADALSAFLASFRLRPVQAFAIAVIAAQAIVIGTLIADRTNDPLYSEVRGSGRTERTVLQVRFKSDAPEAALRDLLYRSGARIVDGPDQLGDYVLSPRRGSIEELAGALASSPLVQNVMTVHDWDSEDGK